MTPSSAGRHARGVKTYLAFAKQLGIANTDGTVSRPGEMDLIGFVTHLASTGSSPKTCQNHLQAVGLWFESRTGRDPRFGDSGRMLPRLDACMKGIKREHSKPKKVRAALTTDKLRLVIRALKRSLDYDNPIDKLMLSAALQLAVMGLLRVGEFTHKQQRQLLRRKKACRRDVEFIRDSKGALEAMEVFIVDAKTDRNREGQRIKLWTSELELCAVRAMETYLSATEDRSPDSGLFVDSKGRHLTRNMFEAAIKILVCEAGMDPTAYTTHSCREGGCVSLCALGVSEYEIKLRGRWRSNAYLLYAGITDAMHRATAEKMASLPMLTEAARDASWARYEYEMANDAEG